MIIEAILLSSTSILMIILIFLIFALNSVNYSKTKPKSNHQFKSMTTDINHLKANVSGY